jgi:hypothetical protein
MALAPQARALHSLLTRFPGPPQKNMHLVKNRAWRGSGASTARNLTHPRRRRRNAGRRRPTLGMPSKLNWRRLWSTRPSAAQPADRGFGCRAARGARESDQGERGGERSAMSARARGPVSASAVLLASAAVPGVKERSGEDNGRERPSRVWQGLRAGSGLGQAPATRGIQCREPKASRRLDHGNACGAQPGKYAGLLRCWGGVRLSRPWPESTPRCPVGQALRALCQSRIVRPRRS